MAERVKDIGKVALTYKGEWVNTTQYGKLDTVYIESEKSTYIALEDNKGVNPVDNPDTWGVLAKAKYEVGQEDFEKAVTTVLTTHDNVIKGKIDNADKWATPIKINGVDVDGTKDITITAVPSNDTNIVHRTGDETVDGEKTFVKPIVGGVKTNATDIPNGTDMYTFLPDKNGYYFIGDAKAATLVNPPFEGTGFFLEVVSSIDGTSYVSLVATAYNTMKKKVAMNSKPGKNPIANRVPWTDLGGTTIDETNIVHRTGDETIGGTKTFTTPIQGGMKARSMTNLNVNELVKDTFTNAGTWSNDGNPVIGGALPDGTTTYSQFVIVAGTKNNNFGHIFQYLNSANEIWYSTINNGAVVGWKKLAVDNKGAIPINLANQENVVTIKDLGMKQLNDNPGLFKKEYWFNLNWARPADMPAYTSAYANITIYSNVDRFFVEVRDDAGMVVTGIYNKAFGEDIIWNQGAPAPLESSLSNTLPAYSLKSTLTATQLPEANIASNHLQTHIVPMLAGNAKQFDLDAVVPENFDVIIDGNNAVIGTAPVPVASMKFSRLEYRWAQYGSINRLYEKLMLTTTPDNAGEYWYRAHTGTTWKAWKKVITQSDLPGTDWGVAKQFSLTSDYFSGTISLTVQSGIVSMNFGGALIKDVGAGDTIIGNTSSVGIPAPAVDLRTSLVDVTTNPPSGNPLLGSVRWKEDGDINLNLNQAIKASDVSNHYIEFGLSGASKAMPVNL